MSSSLNFGFVQVEMGHNKIKKKSWNSLQDYFVCMRHDGNFFFLRGFVVSLISATAS